MTIVAARSRLAGSAGWHEGGRSPACWGSTRGAVNVKASTGNLDGPEGAGRCISALGVASLAGRPRMTLRLHDTLTGEPAQLVPARAWRVRVYSCGPTVYGPAHIGNFRSFLFADLLVRYLR